jgi:hypothetical protein
MGFNHGARLAKIFKKKILVWDSKKGETPNCDYKKCCERVTIPRSPDLSKPERENTTFINPMSLAP